MKLERLIPTHFKVGTDIEFLQKVLDGTHNKKGNQLSRYMTKHYVGEPKPISQEWKTVLRFLLEVCPICGGRKNNLTATTCGIGCANTYFKSGKNANNYKGETYRSICWKNHKKECLICGESRIVEVHHIDENHENNEPRNLAPLCSTHHRYWHSRYKYLVEQQVLDYVDNPVKPE